jgi:hypothetical protein
MTFILSDLTMATSGNKYTPCRSALFSFIQPRVLTQMYVTALYETPSFTPTQNTGQNYNLIPFTVKPFGAWTWCTMQSQHVEATSCSASQEIPCLHSSPLLARTLSHMNACILILSSHIRWGLTQARHVTFRPLCVRFLSYSCYVSNPSHLPLLSS